MAGSIDLGTYPFSDGTSVSFALDFDDSLHAISLRCDNEGTANAFCRVAAVTDAGVESTTAVYGQSFPPGTTVIAIPDSPANKVIALTANPTKPGKYRGINVSAQVPG